jgi:two-component system, LytTR family, sensor kinase
MGLHAHQPLLVNILGHAAGALIFGIFFYLLVRDRGGARLRGGRVPMAAAALALVWNLGSLLALARPDAAGVELMVSFAAISLLPAVLFHLSLAGRYRALWIAGYVVSVLSIAAHLSELPGTAAERHSLALLITTAGFGILSAASAVTIVFLRPRDTRRLAQRLVAALCVFLFALSFVHFDPAHAEQAWSHELIVHHAGIPLALLVLLQDHRFLLLDAFLRFLANVLLAAVFLFAVGAAALRFAGPALSGGNSLHQGLLFVAGSLLLVLFAMLRRGLQNLLTRMVFRRPDIETTLAQLRAGGTTASGETAYLESALSCIARFMGAEPAAIAAGELQARLARSGLAAPTLASDLSNLREDLDGAGAEVVVPLTVSGQDVRCFLLGRRHGGRRYLSEDLEALARLARAASEQLERYHRAEVERLVAQAELRALHAQINPHFLFNALNTLYGVIPKPAQAARRLVLNLADVFRYFLQSQRTLVPLEDELKIVKAYLEIEQERLGARLRVEFDVPADALTVLIPSLSIQPLVENAVKHGVAGNPEGGCVRLTVSRVGEVWRVEVDDTGAGAGAPRSETLHGGVGLENVTRRLKLCYGPTAELLFERSGSGASARFQVPVPSREVHA